MKLLAVDDDPVFLGVLVLMLNTLGQDEVTVAPSGMKALEILHLTPEPFDCILLDIQMPGMTGVELCQRIRSISAYRRTPIVMITAMTGKRFIDDAFAAGATDYVTKPLDAVDLKARLGMVTRLLNERRITATLEQKFDQRHDAVTIDVDFDSPFPVPGFARGIDYLALENYLLMLGNKRMYNTAALGISVQNAGAFYRKASASAFVNMLGDVGSAITDATKADQMMIAYAGAGNFVAVLSGNSAIDREDLQMALQAGIEDFASFYAADRLPLPQIKVGKLVRASFFGLFNPTNILENAVALAQSDLDGKAKAWWSAA
ncbi:hypothetical protein GCM10010873_09890 [Cypionkella aquatica]|uniref:Response regulatory domain-containing protein n=1 Tax=Cypionkella aquatica TaxID=1756042 RepID=A0AA37X0R1_9RHOB|nr:response regulator [Cypionkella aquatica]GLS86015.1 hypothetical protein GCM10010873_09890 [Cypionkella aquatica]